MASQSKTPVVCGWDFRANEDAYNNEEELIKLLKEHAKEFVFQLEKGETTGYKHWQGRLRLIKKTTKSCLLKKMPKMNYVAPTSGGVHSSNNFNYAMKDDTRIKGPWKSIDFINNVERKGLPPIYVEWDGDETLREDQLYDFQRDIIKSGSDRNTRKIDVIANKGGNVGKSSVMDYIIRHGLGIRIPPTVNSADDIMQMLYCKLESGNITDPRIIVIDMPRAIKQDKLTGIFTACEEIKNGWCYDKRYNFKEKKFKSPRIWVFMNQVPKLEWLTPDRWNIWDISDEKKLVQINGNRVPVYMEEYDDAEEEDE